MKISRFFDSDDFKGEKGYLDTQKKYEIVRTILYFGISLTLYIAGYVTTKSNMNLLTVVAVLGCLPGCKSLVSMIMFLKFKSLPKDLVQEFETHSTGFSCLYDMVFTTYDRNFAVGHMVLRGNTVIGYITVQKKYEEAVFIKHLTDSLALDSISGITFKFFTEKEKYLKRMEQLQSLEDNGKLNDSVGKTLKSISL